MRPTEPKQYYTPRTIDSNFEGASTMVTDYLANIDALYTGILPAKPQGTLETLISPSIATITGYETPAANDKTLYQTQQYQNNTL